jgi:hypothetical protein
MDQSGVEILEHLSDIGAQDRLGEHKEGSGMTKRDSRLLMAAVAGMSMAASTPTATGAVEAKTEVRCWGVNSCEGKGAVTDADVKAFKELLGDKEYSARFGKTETHACSAHAKCGAADHILNWEPASAADCKAKSGYVVEEVGPDKKKVARKA